MSTKETIEAAYKIKHEEWVAGGRKPSIRNVCDQAEIGRKYLQSNHPDIYDWLATKTQQADKKEKTERAVVKADEQEETINRLRDRISDLEDTVKLLARKTQAEAIIEAKNGDQSLR
jgi:hypothetical protein